MWLDAPPPSVRRILVVDDSDDERGLVLDRLERALVKNPIVPCSSGEDAVDRLSRWWTHQDPEEWPCLLLLDLTMPEMSGFDVLTWLHVQPDIHGLKVIVVSNSQNPADIERAKALHADGFLMKFPSTQCLASIVRMAAVGPAATARCEARCEK